MAEPFAKTAAVRYESLDWLRGLLAVSIMLYHLIGWDIAPLKADTLLGRLGVYGVSMFFVLSGLSIALAYNRSFSDWGSVWRFGVRRAFRIWPVLWLAVIAMSLLLASRGHMPSLRQIVLNLTTLYGFVQPTGGINVGAWSIGNEMVYYSLTPIIIALYNRSVRLGNVMLLLTLAVGAGFAFSWMTPAATLAAQWPIYVKPSNNLFLYTAGIALYYNTVGQTWSNARSLTAMAVAASVFALYPVSGDQILIVTGLNRVVFSAAAVLLVLSFFKLNVTLPPIVATPLTQLGLATYGVYLLHPLVREACRLVLPEAGVTILMPLTILLTLLVSLIVYHRFELPLMQIGKRLTRQQPQPAHAI